MVFVCYVVLAQCIIVMCACFSHNIVCKYILVYVLMVDVTVHVVVKNKVIECFLTWL